MATTGKIPMLGFKAAAIKFATLFGFTPNDAVAEDTPRVIPMTGSYVISPAMTGSYVIAAAMTGSYVPSPAMTGSVSDG